MAEAGVAGSGGRHADRNRRAGRHAEGNRRSACSATSPRSSRSPTSRRSSTRSASVPVANTPAQFAHADQGRDGKMGQGGARRQAEDRVRSRTTDRGSKSDDENHACDRARRGVSRFRFGIRPAISEQAGEDHHPVPGRRRDRSCRTADRAEAVGEARPAVLHREHRRRRRQSRHGAGRARAGRRLHRAAVVIERHGEPEPLQQDAVRRGEGPDPGHQGRRLAELVAGQSETSRPRT